MNKVLILLSIIIVGLSIIIKNIYLFILFIASFTIVLSYNFNTKGVINRNISKKQVSNKIDLYCREIDNSNYIVFFYLLLMDSDLGLSALTNFFHISFKEQFGVVLNISIIILMLVFILTSTYIIFDFKKGILYKEGLLLNDGELYRFNDVEKYEFKTSFRGYKYRDVILTYKNDKVKTVFINKDDMDKFEALLDKGGE